MPALVLTISAGSTYTASGCPQTCTSFTQNNPGAFSEAYWSINNLRVYTESGKAASGDGLSGGAIAGIVVGVVVGLGLVAFFIWRWRRKQASKWVQSREHELWLITGEMPR